MKKAIAALFALATAVVSLTTAECRLLAQQPLTPEQTLDRRAIGERGGGPDFSPDGSRVVFTVAEPVKGAARARALDLRPRARPIAPAHAFRQERFVAAVVA